MGKTSSAVKDRYNKKAYEDVRLRVKQGQKTEIQTHAAAQGKSLNGYIVGLIEADMAKANPPPPIQPPESQP